ncbi:MAG TPA: hypothetical protein IAB52_07005 [Candidatus Scatomonas merdavium]|nr:hypothetical protein [Candidatus Scatomonas merdavium]
MLYCSKCGISIRGNKRCCPLCQGELTGTPSEAAFPTLKRARITSLSLVKLFTFLFIALEIVWSAVGFLADFTLAWVPFAMAGTLVAWLDAVLAVYFRNNVVKNITIQVYLVMIGGFVIDRFTGFHGWSVQWLIPCCFLGLVTTTIALGRGLPLRLEEYILYLAVDMVLSLLQTIFLVMGMNAFVWPAVISMAALLILGVAALLFRFRDLKNASEKLFHM